MLQWHPRSGAEMQLQAHGLENHGMSALLLSVRAPSKHHSRTPNGSASMPPLFAVIKALGIRLQDTDLWP